MDVVVALKKLYQLQYNKHGYQPIIKLIRLKVLEKEDGFDKKQKFRRIPIADIFKGKYWKMPIRKVLVEGDAGIGKTTLCNIVSEGWANGKLYQQFDLLLHLPLRNKELISAASFSELLRKLSPSTAVSDSVKMGKEKILVVADGWEELAEALQSKKSFLYRLLFGDIPSVSVILTSRRNSFHSYGYFDRFVELCGFNEESIDMYVQSRFSSDQEKANLLLNKLKCLPLVKSLCSIPLNCAMICNLWQYHPGEAFHTNITVTELYAKSVLISILKNMQKSGNYVTFSEIADLDALPEGIQHRFLLLCKLAFVAITNCQVVFTHQDLINFFPRVETGDILPFGLVQLNDSISYGETYSFPHLSLQEYLATLYIVKQPISMNEQLKLLMKLNHRGMMIWRFYSGIVFGRREPIENLSQIQSNIIEMNVLPYTSSLEAKSLHNLSHFALEANNKEFDNGVNQYITNECYVCHLASAYDCAAMLYIITVIDNCEVVITSCNSGIRADQVLTLADNLANKCGSIQIKELYLAHDKLSDECLSYFFHQGISAFKALEKLCLSGNSIKTRGMTSIMSLMDICSGTLTQLDLSHNILDILEIQMLTDIVGRLSKLQELFLKRSLSHDADLDLLYLPKLLRTILSNCHDFSKLDMSDNNLGSPGLSTLFRSNVFGWQNIHLAMNDNKIDDNFLESLDGFHLPRRLELRENSIHESGLCFLAYGVRTGKLLMHESTELFLDSNPLDLKGALAISKTLSTSCCLLSRLSLSNCNLTTVGDSFLHSEKFSSQVVEGIGRQLHHMAQNDTLIWLNLDDNNFTGQGIHILIGFLHLCPRLKWLSTNSCGITSDDFIELIVKLSGYKSSSTHTKICEELQSWYLGNNKIDSYALSIVLDQLPSLFPSIQVCDGFYLHDNPISISMMEHLQIKLKNCKDEHSVASQWTEPHEGMYHL